ncbi:MAG: hypothetical protein K2H91_07585 [Lachnospiraceae bacterium]|nr:hypothetical protein [Lachnospiraceae bacterium]
MSLRQYVRRHLTIVICLLLIGYGIAVYIQSACPEKIGQTQVRGMKIAFDPIYNDDGSMFHAKLNIGYRQGLLILESVLGLVCIWIMYKMVLYYRIFFGMKSWWSYFVDFGCAAAIARVLIHLTGQYVLDYLYIWVSNSTYDFFDFCIGICVVGMLIWFIPACVKYYKYKHEKTKGMHFWEKFKWEIWFSVEMTKMLFCPIKAWWKDIN